ncbi:MAG: hypothetical protein GF353_17410 [Candidatus Lokiarchaeota archaeon]|nr:hypothetical protein [Candidatus Lokiarchaeota archaeon]
MPLIKQIFSTNSRIGKPFRTFDNNENIVSFYKDKYIITTIEKTLKFYNVENGELEFILMTGGLENIQEVILINEDRLVAFENRFSGSCEILFFSIKTRQLLDELKIERALERDLDYYEKIEITKIFKNKIAWWSYDDYNDDLFWIYVFDLIERRYLAKIPFNKTNLGIDLPTEIFFDDENIIVYHHDWRKKIAHFYLVDYLNFQGQLANVDLLLTVNNAEEGASITNDLNYLAVRLTNDKIAIYDTNQNRKLQEITGCRKRDRIKAFQENNFLYVRRTKKDKYEHSHSLLIYDPYRNFIKTIFENWQHKSISTSTRIGSTSLSYYVWDKTYKYLLSYCSFFIGVWEIDTGKMKGVIKYSSENNPIMSQFGKYVAINDSVIKIYKVADLSLPSENFADCRQYELTYDPSKNYYVIWRQIKDTNETYDQTLFFDTQHKNLQSINIHYYYTNKYAFPNFLYKKPIVFWYREQEASLILYSLNRDSFIGKIIFGKREFEYTSIISPDSKKFVLISNFGAIKLWRIDISEYASFNLNLKETKPNLQFRVKAWEGFGSNIKAQFIGNQMILISSLGFYKLVDLEKQKVVAKFDRVLDRFYYKKFKQNIFLIFGYDRIKRTYRGYIFNKNNSILNKLSIFIDWEEHDTFSDFFYINEQGILILTIERKGLYCFDLKNHKWKFLDFYGMVTDPSKRGDYYFESDALYYFINSCQYKYIQRKDELVIVDEIKSKTSYFSEKRIRIWNFKTGQKLNDYILTGSDIEKIKVTSNGLVIIAYHDGFIKYYDLYNKEMIMMVKVNSGGYGCFSYFDFTANDVIITCGSERSMHQTLNIFGQIFE